MSPESKNSTVTISLEPEVVGASGQKPVIINMSNAAGTDAKEAAASAAASAGVAYFTQSAKNGVVELKKYVVENPTSLKTIGLLLGSVLIGFSCIGVINLFNALHPVAYILNFFNLVFGMMVFVMEGKDTWTFFGLRARLFDNFGLLASPLGRAFFYFYIGILLIGMLPEGVVWLVLYIILGSAFIVNGLVQIGMAWKNRNQSHTELNDANERI